MRWAHAAQESNLQFHFNCLPGENAGALRGQHPIWGLVQHPIWGLVQTPQDPVSLLQGAESRLSRFTALLPVDPACVDRP